MLHKSVETARVYTALRRKGKLQLCVVYFYTQLVIHIHFSLFHRAMKDRTGTLRDNVVKVKQNKRFISELK